jgi:hypothetical protein
MALDAEAAVRDWVNANTALVGDGKPLTRGAYLKLLRSPYGGTYAYLSVIGGTPRQVVAERVAKPFVRARIGAQIFGTTKESAAAAAVAYCNAVEALLVGPTPMGTAAVCLFADAISGPLELAFGPEVRYAVDCDFILRPV